MPDSPVVTAVIPAFNAEAFLADAIDSVLGQTYPHMRVVVVDDGSVDGTAVVASRYGAAVTCVRQPNAGVSAARNRGVSESSSELVAFLDADDVWRPEKIQRQVEALADRPDVGLVYTGLTITDEALRPVLDVPGPPAAVALRNTLLMEPPVMSVAQTALVRRSVFEALGGFDVAMSTSADADFACRAALLTRVEGLRDALVLYRQHQAQMHLDPEAVERDMRRVHAKVFADPNLPVEIRRLRRRAAANLQFTLALDFAHRGQPGRAGSAFSRAAVSDPFRVVALLATGTARRIRRGLPAREPSERA